MAIVARAIAITILLAISDASIAPAFAGRLSDAVLGLAAPEQPSRSNGLERTGRLKIGVIDAGAVGSARLLSSILRGIAREIVVVNRDRKRAKAVVTDLQYGAALSSVVQICDGDRSACR